VTTIQWDRTAFKDLERLDKPVRIRILEAVERFKTTGHGDVAYLEGTVAPRQYRLRVGEWRLAFTRTTEPGGTLVTFLWCRKRGEAYRSM
jgi:mRNA-degrading endonuclease RelE of RelBE toxin-antitoxin system